MAGISLFFEFESDLEFQSDLGIPFYSPPFSPPLPSSDFASKCSNSDSLIEYINKGSSRSINYNSYKFVLKASPIDQSTITARVSHICRGNSKCRQFTDFPIEAK